ncbi:MAG TPA: hypothetical protein VM820_18060 [Vicinamibacterales bacterium]|nr:hypothetical protein [Vicinamibacterales bacterium]
MIDRARLAGFMLFVCSWPASSLAQTSAGDQAAAQALFDDAKTLVAGGRAAEACPKFEESQRLDPGLGTQLNLADCYERIGRTASAWTLYEDVAVSARRQGQDVRAEHAEKRATALKPALSKLVISVPAESRVPGLNITRDTAVVREAQWGFAVPVDPGQHTISVSAPNKEVWQTMVEVQPNGATRSVTVPVLKDAAGEQGAAPLASGQTPALDRGTPEQSERGKGQRIGGLVTMGVGAVGLGLGAFFGVQAMGKKSDAGCDGNACPDATSKSLYEDAQSAGTISTIAFAIGGVALAGGAVLYLTAPSASESASNKIRAQASIGPGLVQLGAGGRF